jgi:hypothetical protein
MSAIRALSSVHTSTAVQSEWTTPRDREVGAMGALRDPFGSTAGCSPGSRRHRRATAGQVDIDVPEANRCDRWLTSTMRMSGGGYRIGYWSHTTP